MRRLISAISNAVFGVRYVQQSAWYCRHWYWLYCLFFPWIKSRKIRISKELSVQSAQWLWGWFFQRWYFLRRLLFLLRHFQHCGREKSVTSGYHGLRFLFLHWHLRCRSLPNFQSCNSCWLPLFSALYQAIFPSCKECFLRLCLNTAMYQKRLLPAFCKVRQQPFDKKSQSFLRVLQRCQMPIVMKKPKIKTHPPKRVTRVIISIIFLLRLMQAQSIWLLWQLMPAKFDNQRSYGIHTVCINFSSNCMRSRTERKGVSQISLKNEMMFIQSK